MDNLICLVKGCEMCGCYSNDNPTSCPNNRLAREYTVGVLYTHCAYGCGRYLYGDGRWKFTQEAEQ